MKKLLLTVFCGILLSPLTHAQGKASDVFRELNKMPDQFDEQYNGASVSDKLTLIYIPGTNNPFQKIYFKQKAAKIKDDVLLVGGFKEMMNAMSLESKRKHLQEALEIQYKEGSRILLDLESEIGKLLSIKGYSIITLSKKTDKVIAIDDYGFDRVAFFKELSKYEAE